MLRGYGKKALACLMLVFAFLNSSLLVQGKTFDEQLEKLSKKETYAGLPVENVSVDKEKNDWGVVIFLPQFHKAPASKVSDSKNDRGELVQKETYATVSKLLEKLNIDFAMIEGQNEGLVSEEKKQNIKKFLIGLENFSKSYDVLKTAISNKSKNKFVADFISEVENNFLPLKQRELILQGAMMKLWAEGKIDQLYGAEDPETIAESETLVRDYIYLNDRIAQLTPKNISVIESKNINLSRSLDKDVLKLYLAQKNKSKKKNNINSDLKALENLYKDNSEILSFLENFSIDLSALNYQKVMENKNLPSRKDNPYKKETDLENLKDRLSTLTKDIDRVVIEKRNKQTAENFAETLRETEENIGILQFGAGHKEGLVKELKKQGLTVVTVEVKSID